MPEKNALAELAETMSTPVEIAPVDADGLVVLNTEQLLAYQKAQRIVAELSKIEDVDMLHGFKHVRVPNMYQCHDAVVNCRAIAEEEEK